MENRREWLDGLVAGDEVVVGNSIRRIDRTTKSFIFIGDCKYLRVDGWKTPYVGWHTGPGIQEPTPERLAAIALRLEKRKMMEWVRDVLLQRISDGDETALAAVRGMMEVENGHK